jgi:hypothetical protein
LPAYQQWFKTPSSFSLANAELSGSTNKTCGQSGTPWNIGSQADVDSMLGGCTDLNGTVNIVQSYSGSLTLAGVTTIREFHSDAGASLTNITMDNLTNINNFSLIGSSVTTLSFPSLIAADVFSVDTTNRLNLNLPALANLSDIKISGKIAR